MIDIWKDGKGDQMKSFVLVLVSCLLISACATSNKAQIKADTDAWLNSLLGQNIDVVVNKLGYPLTNFIAPNGNKVFVWGKGEDKTRPMMLYRATPNSSIALGGDTQTYWCKVYFEVDASNIIIRYSYEGNYCF
jgi:hypothetical protein